VNGSAGTLTSCVQPADTGLAELVRFDPAHRVVLAWFDRHWLFEPVDALKVFRQVENILQAVLNPVFTQVAHVEVDVLVFDSAPLLHLG
jgi:hypothetical protein